jgi:H+/Na+-translocating ferredoxin:NAD+ oxidoreductase subunit G
MTEQRLPVVTSDGGGGDAGPGAPPIKVEASSARLVGTLAFAGAIAGLAIVLAFQWANPRIEIWRAKVLSEAITEVLAGADRYETVFLDDGAFTATPVADTADLDRIFVGYGSDDRPVGVAVAAGEPGFQDVIELIFGFDPSTGEVIGMKVLESKETPGLGDKITKDSAFIGGFDGVDTPLIGVKKGRERGAAGEVTMITGATISSRAVIAIINHRLEAVQAPIEAYWASVASGRGGS